LQVFKNLLQWLENYSRHAARLVKSVVAVAAEEVDLGPLVVHQGLPGEPIGLVVIGAAVLARVGIAHVLACSGQGVCLTVETEGPEGSKSLPGGDPSRGVQP
jgi:hypothetical protein